MAGDQGPATAVVVNDQVVVCEVKNLGTLENTITQQTERQPNEP